MTYNNKTFLTTYVTRGFDNVFSASQYYKFKDNFLLQFSKWYCMKTVYESNDINIIDDVIELHPIEEGHRWYYFHFILNKTEKNYYSSSIGSPNTVSDSTEQYEYIFNRCLNLARVPNIYFLGTNYVKIDGAAMKFSSKGKMLNAMVPFLAKRITSSWNFTERCALARSLLTKEKTMRNFDKEVNDVVSTKIKVFLANYNTRSISCEKLFQMFASYYNIYEQYLLYKF